MQKRAFSLHCHFWQATILFSLFCLGAIASMAQKASTDFVTTWKTNNPGSDSKTIIIPTTGGGYNYDVDWDNDGVWDDFGLTGNATHIYSVEGTYTVRIRGAFPRIYFNNTGDRQKILSINQWGNIAWTSMESAFYGASNLTYSATDNPNLSGVTSLARMFENASSFNGAIGGWNVSTVTDMALMFSGATVFNGNISAWNVSNVEFLNGMFQNTSAFNQNIGGWNTAKVKSFGSMFNNAYAFNQNLGGWNIQTSNNFNNTLRNSALSISNYDLTLIGWAAQPVMSGRAFGVHGLTYCNGLNARTTLVSTYGWNITGDTYEPVCSPLPVELTAFSARLAAGNAVALHWETASEHYNDYFEVERSVDGNDWAALGKVAGAGSSALRQAYTFYDEHPAPGMNYYRLQQVDFDGETTHSDIVSVELQPVGGQFAIYPNPATSTAYLSVKSSYRGEASLGVYDLFGRQLHVQTFEMEGGRQQVVLALNGMAAGSYFVKVNAGPLQWHERLVLADGE